MSSKKIRIIVPEGSKGLVKPGRNGEPAKMIMPPGKLKVVGEEADGSVVLEPMEQDDLQKTLSDMERRVQKASTTMTGDERREAGKTIDSIRKKKVENLQRTGISPKKSQNHKKIAQNNSEIMKEIRRNGGMPFEHYEVSESVKKDIQRLDAMYGTTYSMDLDDAYEEFTDTVRKTIDSLRNPTGEVVEEDVKVSRIFQKVIEKKNNDEIIEILEKLAVQIHAGFERFVAIDATDDMFNFLSERKVFTRPSSNGSHAEIQKDADLTLGISRKADFDVRPIAGTLSHAGYKIDNKTANNKNFKKEFYSEATTPRILLKPEVFGRSGYSRNGGIFNRTYSVSCVSRETENITLAILGAVNSSNSEQKNIELIDTYLEAAVTGDYSQVIGTRENPGFTVYVMGGFEKDEIEVIEYPLSILDTSSVRIQPLDPVLGEDTVNLKLKNLGLTSEQISSFMAPNGPMGDIMKLEPVMVYLQTKAADKVKVELSQLNISNIRFVNPRGIDIFDPYVFQDLNTRLLESGSRIVTTIAIDAVDKAVNVFVEKMKKDSQKDKKK